MPVNPTYPGVYVEELPSAVRPVVGVSTSITAFVGRFLRGPSNVAVTVRNWGDFERDFGGLWRQASASYQVQQFFLNGGSQAEIVRVGTAGLAPAVPFVTAELQLRNAVPPDPNSVVVRARAGRRVRGRTVLDPGSWGNLLRLEVDYNVEDPAATEFFNLTVLELAATGGRLTVRNSEKFHNLTLRPGHRRNAPEVVNAASKLVQLDVDLTPVPDPFPADYRPAPTGTLSDPLPVAVPADGALVQVNLNGVAVGAPVPVAHLGLAPADMVAYRPLLEQAIRLADPNDPRIAGLRVELFPMGAAQRYRVLAGRGGDNFDPEDRVTLTNVVGTALGLDGPANVQMYSVGTGATGAQTGAVAGDDGIAVDEAALSGLQGAKTGLYALEDADLFNLMSVPEAVELGTNDMTTLYNKALAFCRDQRAFLLVDLPETVVTVDGVLAWATTIEGAGLRSDHAATFFPRLRIPDPLQDGLLRSRPASGTMAGLFARIDGDRGVWKAPAGTEARLRNVPELDCNLTDGENGTLNPLAINALRTFPFIGNVSWGARTLEGADILASQWKYIPVRRLALYLEESLYRGLQWAVFEPNDEPLWSQIRLNVGTFLHDLFRKGAFQGSTPGDAYSVQCDAETTPQSDIDKGIVNVIVGFAPLKPAEFVILKIRQLAGQQQPA
ncbi:MAG TPA: phage tail sheath C-terminal domain-containing protein [Thermoanaerobaculia bacterium]|nr:phage tail sheath C-terminal domain-containing protein [Thermoanaerobaculia bacterium]